MPIRLVTQSISDALVASLRERIITDQISVGAPLTEASVSAQYDVARQTAKAAIARLVGEGLLERTAHRSARVPALDEARVRDLYFACAVVEVRGYQLLAQQRLLTEAVGRAHEAFLAAASGTDIASIVQTDAEFHRTLIDSLGSERLSRAHGLIINEIRLCLAQVQNAHLLGLEKISREHDGILAAVQDGDPDRAGELGQQHLEHAERKLLAHLRG
ncbi:GntR family transcriptional regulator [Streptomyces sp. SID8352]|uniref:GntR family transcriptional regulator n=1 Tax=Streptomyces sp. SID8352 TaxID=2690338 RepID=UPI001367A401|nr:GntR family transcriptional regulator [Streptomyces sp. SID8352]MYU21130.1 FCD domain-containing protein [Streptomyces sp. SID8352]